MRGSWPKGLPSVGRFSLRRWFRHSLNDLEAGDAVRVVGYRGVAFVESVHGETALIVWAKDRRAVMPLLSLRRVRPCGGGLDRRW
jgi:hypothetical protein